MDQGSRLVSVWSCHSAVGFGPMDAGPLSEKLRAFADAVRASPHNLLSQRALGEVEDRHIAESLAFASALPGDTDLLDLGTGGGFPGMLVALARPDIRVSLLDATRKKIDFLAATSKLLGVDVQTMHGRAEELWRSHGSSYDIVTARAVAALDTLVGWSLPFLRPGGALWAIKGERWAEELEQALPTLTRARAKVEAVPGGPGSPAPDATRIPTDVGIALDAAMPRVVIIRAPGK